MKRPLEVYERPHCANCGQLFTWEQVTAERVGYDLRFCSTNCLGIFDTYLLPTYGPSIIKTLDKSVFETVKLPKRKDISVLHGDTPKKV